MNVSMRALAAMNAKEPPHPADLEALRGYLGRPGPSNPDELACDVIQKALFERAKARAAQTSAAS